MIWETLAFALKKWQPGANEIQHLNVGTGVDLTIRQLAESIAEAIGFKGHIIWDKSKPDGTPKSN